jgi:hypothetical protein
MKKAILGAWFAMMGLGAYAQTGSPAPPGNMADMPQVSTNNDIRQLANQLQLNEGQYIRLRDLSKARQEQITEINSMYSNDPAMRQAKIKAAQQEFDSNLAQSITSKQFTAYLQLQGRSPGAAGAPYQAGGYGGRSLEEGATTQPAKANPTPAATTPVAAPLDTNLDKGKVEVTDKVVKIRTEEGEMKVKAKKEKAETADMKYKVDRDETKIKSKDGTIKAKSEKGKTKMETPQGKVKNENGEVKVVPKKD